MFVLLPRQEDSHRMTVLQVQLSRNKALLFEVKWLIVSAHHVAECALRTASLQTAAIYGLTAWIEVS